MIERVDLLLFVVVWFIVLSCKIWSWFTTELIDSLLELLCLITGGSSIYGRCNNGM